ncbi:MAG: hypothetical protein ACOCP4_00815 [Candidatus Woesearchaeota archaeon]
MEHEINFLPKEILDDVNVYIEYLKERGFEKVIHFPADENQFLYVYWHENPDILIHFDDFLRKYSDGSGDGSLCVNGGTGIHLFMKPKTGKYIGSSKHMDKNFDHMVFDVRSDIDEILFVCGDNIIDWQNNGFMLHLWHHAIRDDKSSALERLNSMNEFHNQVWYNLPDKFQSIIKKQKNQELII